MQRSPGPPAKPAGTIAWWEHLEAWEVYGRKYNQSAEVVAQRGGFGRNELLTYLGHEPTTFEEYPNGRQRRV